MTAKELVKKKAFWAGLALIVTAIGKAIAEKDVEGAVLSVFKALQDMQAGE